MTDETKKTDSCVLALLAVKELAEVPKEVLEKVVRSIREQGGDLRKVKARSEETLAWIARHKAAVALAEKRLNKIDKRFPDDPNMVHEAGLVGSTRTGKDLKNSISVNSDAITIKHQTLLHQLLGKIMDVVDDPDLTKSIFKAVSNIGNGLGIEKGVVGETAHAVYKFNKYLVQELREAGLEINDRQGYILRQTHDVGKIGKATFSTWAKDIYGLLDKSATFGEVVEQAEHLKILKRMYDDIVTAQYGIQGSSSVGHARTLHFLEGGEAAADYHVKYGEGSIYQVLQKSARTAAKAEAIRRIHPEGRKGFEKLEAKQQAKILKTGDAALEKKFNRGASRRQRLRDQVFGYGLHPTHHLVREVGRALRTLQAVTKLAYSATSTTTDLTFAQLKLMSISGEGLLSSTRKLFNNYHKTWRGLERDRLASLMMMHLEFDTSSRYTDTEGMKGIYSKITNYSMKMTFLDKITKVNRLTMSTTLMELHASKEFDVPLRDLDLKARAELESFSITSQDWDLIRDSKADALKTRIIDVSNISDRDAQIKYMNMLWHGSKFGAIAPGASVKAMMNFGAHPDSVAGQIVQTAFQFKTFGLEAGRALSEILRSNPHANNRTLLKSLENWDNRKLLGAAMVSGFSTALTGLWARDLLNGKAPRALDGATVADAFTRGVLPLQITMFSDIFTGANLQYNKDIVSDLLGPTAGLINDTWSLAANSVQAVKGEFGFGKEKDIRAQSFKYFRRNVPGVAPVLNFPLVKPLLDSWFFDEMLENWNPGHKKRTLKREEKKGSLLDQLGL